MIEFEHLFQFVAFGMYGTLSKTAEILHVSQPTLTRNMKLLEKEFGVILFARIKSVSSTAQGIPCHWEAVPPILSWTLYG